VLLSVVVIASRFLTVGPALYFLGYGPRIGTLCSLALAQAGEFGLVIVALGLSLGHIGRDVASILALTLIITSTVSTYMMIANHRIARRVVGVLGRLGVRERAHAEPPAGEGHPAHEIVVLGFHRAASSLLHLTQGSNHRHDILVVDFSPEVRRELEAMQVPIIYGDISHLDTLDHAGVEKARVVISTVSEDFLRGTDNLTLLRQVKQLNPDARVILSAETFERAREMYEAGADYVVLPRDATARRFLDVLEATERGELDDLRARALADLEDRTEVLA
jgi:voltage-gated potassium channel Kch